MCRFKMVSQVHHKVGDQVPVKKPTGFITSSRAIAARLDAKCEGGHTHVHLMSGHAAGAQVYQEELCRAILRGTLEQKRLDERAMRVSTGAMKLKDARIFLSALSTYAISSVREHRGGATPVGEWPK